MATRTPRNGPISDELLDRLLAGRDPAEAFRSGEEEQASRNHCNGHNRKRALTESEAMDLEVPRDRQGSFEPRLVERYARRLPGFDDKVISMYARGMTRQLPARCGERRGD